MARAVEEAHHSRHIWIVAKSLDVSTLSLKAEMSQVEEAVVGEISDQGGCGAEVMEEDVVKRGISPWRGCRVVGAGAPTRVMIGL